MSFVPLIGLAAVLGGCAEAEPRWRIAFVDPGSEASAAALRGLQLGVEEANHAGQLIGRELELVTARAADPDRSARVARRLARRGAVAVVGGFDEPTCAALARTAEEEGFLFLNVGCRDEGLRASQWRRTLHVEASHGMYAGAAHDGVLPVLWDSGLTRFGAAQLNERFERRFDRKPTAAEWAGWMGAKVVWEALLRTERSEPTTLLAFLESRAAEFDGHKGEPLSFHPATGQLQQPLFSLTPSSAPARPTEPGLDLPEWRGLGGSAAALLFVSNEGSGDVTVIDLERETPIGRIPLEHRPRGIHLAPDGSRLYVAISDHDPLDEGDADAIAVVDLAAGRVVARHAAGTDPEQFAVAPDGSRLYASNEDAGSASITDLDTGELLSTLVVGIEPEGVAVSPDGRWVYVTAETSNTVSVIDAVEQEVVASFLVEVRPRAAAFSPTRPEAYVTNEISGSLSVVDAREHRVIRTIQLDGGRAKPVGVAVSPDGRWVYVANGHSNSVSVIDADTHTETAVVPAGRRPWGVAVSPDGRRIYTANGLSSDVTVIDAEALEPLGSIPAGELPWGLAVRGR